MHTKILFCAALLAGGLSAAASEIHVRINQLGYGPTARKVAIAMARTPITNGFAIVEQPAGRVVFEGKPRSTRAKWGQFEHHAILDFTQWQRPGDFAVRIGDAQSPAFTIRNGIYGALPDLLLEFMRQQRCGYNPWLDTVCHPFDGRTAYGPLPQGTYLHCPGGWHDAGDLLQYMLTSGNATAQMLLAYRIELDDREKAPRRTARPRVPSRTGARFQDHFNALGQPETNGIPDILDEARWGLDWMLKLHPEPGHLYHQIADDRDHVGFRLPQDDKVDYGWGEGRERVVYFADGQPQGLKDYKSESYGVANLAGRYAAAMGLAHQIWKDDPRHKHFAEQCLQAGIEVYELGKAKEGVQQGNSYKAPYRYAETTWADDMEWGAAELFRATGRKEYLEDAKRYAQLAHTESWMGRDDAGHYQFYPFMNAGHFRLYDLVDAEFQKTLAGYYREGLASCLEAGKRNPYRIGVPFIWCSNNLVVALVTQGLLYERMTGDDQFREFIDAQRVWLVGRNPWGYSMFTEIGTVFPTDVHLQTTKLTERTVVGGLVDGPVYERIFKSLKGVSITEPDPLAEFQDERAVYHNDFKDYSTNEPTMDGTASAILMWALMD